MEQIFTPDRAPTEYRRHRERPAPRPDRFALWAVIMAVVAMIAGVATADASSGGGVGTGGGGGESGKEAGSYDRMWESYSQREKRWAHKTSECESGGNPNAIGGGGRYRGAFQFTRPTWRHSPRSPGGDPIRYSWRTQAVVAVELKQRDGAGHWPVCG